MEPNQHGQATPGEQTQAAQPAYPYPSPPPRYYAAPMPMPMVPSATVLAAPPRSTWLGRWGLGCSILALVLPTLAVLVGNAGGGRAALSLALLMFLTLVFTILGVVFSSIGMSKRYTRRGVAIAGLAVGIVALVPLVLGVVAGVAVFVLGGR